MARGWSYWSRNKLEILTDYLPAFNSASKGKASERIYIDVMAGEPENHDRETGESFDGSARIAMAAAPGFTRFAFGEMPPKAAQLEADLEPRSAGRPFKVYEGDCNATIKGMLADLSDVCWAPTFAFLDQQAAELHWETMAAIAAFRRGKTKAEQWILWSPAMLIKGLTGSNGDLYFARVDRMYGTNAWRRIFAARRREVITAEEFRAEMVNLIRWRLETKLGYLHTARIPMRMLNGVTIYDMVFATDHDVGLKIMSHLYAKAAEREPRMRQEAIERSKQAPRYADDFLFDMQPAPNPSVPKWRSEPCTDPTERDWWD
ncbi:MULTISPECIES: three-Cys-motif partner protein TcmP [unclassified Nocardioides]|uniref:three-Cys-motif partner protein TcmP n=1 Tax=unclassified Nocardioides TaxID=2615069 RepID=UPI0000571027|nr:MULTISPECIES: three-Cys-motif partner protein TcmP [unclassified Nocardioides]ABL79353.1 conserved hypothetical protein [Nocardioides sp. JS614]